MTVRAQGNQKKKKRNTQMKMLIIHYFLIYCYDKFIELTFCIRFSSQEKIQGPQMTANRSQARLVRPKVRKESYLIGCLQIPRKSPVLLRKPKETACSDEAV